MVLVPNRIICNNKVYKSIKKCDSFSTGPHKRGGQSRILLKLGNTYYMNIEYYLLLMTIRFLSNCLKRGSYKTHPLQYFLKQSLNTRKTQLDNFFLSMWLRICVCLQPIDLIIWYKDILICVIKEYCWTKNFWVKGSWL